MGCFGTLACLCSQLPFNCRFFENIYKQLPVDTYRPFLTLHVAVLTRQVLRIPNDPTDVQVDARLPSKRITEW